MLDPKTIVEKLKFVEQEMDVYRWYREAGLSEAVRDAAELIERTTRPMTGKQAAEVMNEIKFNAVNDWKEAKTASDGSYWVESNWINYGFPDWAAVAIVRAYEARKEAGIG